MRKFFLCFLILTPSFQTSLPAAQDGFTFLLLSPAVRSAALAEAFTSVGEGADGVFSNPGGLIFEKNRQYYVQTFIPPFVQGMKYSNFSYIHATRSSLNWSIQSGFLHMGDFTRTVADPSTPDGYRESDSFSTYDYRLSFSLSQKLSSSWGFGATGSFLRESLSDASANAFSSDVGVLYKEKDSPVQLGAAIQHLGTKPKFREESFRLPTTLRAGISFHQRNNLFPKFVPPNSFVTTDFAQRLGGESAVQGGFETPLTPSFFLRAGYRHSFKDQEIGSTLNLPNGLSFGLGIQVKSWRLDYATSSLGELGLLHRIALNYEWHDPNNIPRVLSDSYAR